MPDDPTTTKGRTLLSLPPFGGRGAVRLPALLRPAEHGPEERAADVAEIQPDADHHQHDRDRDRQRRESPRGAADENGPDTQHAAAADHLPNPASLRPLPASSFGGQRMIVRHDRVRDHRGGDEEEEEAEYDGYGFSTHGLLRCKDDSEDARAVEESCPRSCKSCSRARMGFCVDLLQALDARVRVDLRRRDRGVSEELVDGAEIGAGVQKVRGEGVAQRVHREASGLVDLLEELADHELHGAHAYSRAGAREKERGAIDLAAEHSRELIALRLGVAERELRVIADRDYPLLAPLAAHLELLRHEIEHVAIDARKLGEAQSRGIEELENGEIAHIRESALPRARLGHLKQQIDLRAVQIRGEILVTLGRLHRARGICLDDLVSMQELVERSHRRERAPDGALAEPAAREVAHEAADRESVHAAPRPTLCTIVGAQELDKGIEIAAVRDQRVRRIVLLLLQVEKKLVHVAGHVIARARGNAHVATAFGSAPSSACSRIQLSMSASARAAKSSRLRRLSRSGLGRSSSRPKLAFIGWKWAGS